MNLTLLRMEKNMIEKKDRTPERRKLLLQSLFTKNQIFKQDIASLKTPIQKKLYAIILFFEGKTKQ